MLDPRLNRQIHQDHNPEHQKPNDPHRPRIPDPRHQPHKQPRHHHSTHRRPRRRDPKRRGPPAPKPRRDAARAGIVHAAGAEGAADGLAEEQMVVPRRETGHHPAVDVQGGADEEEPLGPVAVEEFAEEEAAGVHGEERRGGDAGECGGGGGRGAEEEGVVVVGLEDAEGVDGDPADEEDAPAAEGYEPGVEAAVWELGGWVGLSQRRRTMGLVDVVIRLRQVTIAAAVAGWRFTANWLGRCDFIVAILDIRSPGAASIVRFRGAGRDGT